MQRLIVPSGIECKKKLLTIPMKSHDTDELQVLRITRRMLIGVGSTYASSLSEVHDAGL